MVDVAASKVPVSYWIVCGLAFLVDVFGAYDYVMIRMQDDEYLRSMQARIPSLIIEWYDNYPLWAHIAWASFTWFALAGSVLLLARSRYAVTAFLIATVGAVLNVVYHLMTPLPPVLEQPVIKAMPYLIVAIMLSQFLYARAVADKILR